MNFKKEQLIIGAIAIGAAVIYLRGVRGFAGDLTRGAISAASGAAEGAIHGASDLIGLPVPEVDKCQQAKAEGNKWDASFYCPATDFLRFVWTS